jgi:hypothetical protein
MSGSQQRTLIHPREPPFPWSALRDAGVGSMPEGDGGAVTAESTARNPEARSRRKIPPQKRFGYFLPVR